MIINRFFTISDNNPYSGLNLKEFLDDDSGYSVLMPIDWSKARRDVWTEEVFCKYKISNNLESLEEPYLPSWMHRKIIIKQGSQSENDIRQVFDRVAGEWVYKAWKNGFFDSEEDAIIFYDEARFIMAHGYALPEISQLKHTGLNWAYGINEKPATPKHKISDPTKAIFDVGFSNSGINFDKISNGQNIDHLLKLINNISLLNSKSNYLLKTKANLSMDIKSSNVMDFINWKRKSEQDEVSKRLGAKVLKSHMNNILDKYDRDSLRGFDPSYNLELRRAIFSARDFKVPDSAIREALLFARQGFESVPILSLDNKDFDDEDIISDNINLSLMVDDEFIESSITGHSLKNNDGNNIDCQIIFDSLVEANWTVGEPDILFSNTINEWSGVSQAEQIKSTGTNAGFLFLEDTSCPTATINLLNFSDDELLLDYPALEYTAKILSIALNTSLSFMDVSDKTKEYNPIGIGYTNLGAVLMNNGIPYDSDEAIEFACLITAYINLSLHEMSIEFANNNEVFYQYSNNMKQFINVLENQFKTISGSNSNFNNVSKKPLAIGLGQELTDRWKEVVKFAKQYGVYNSYISFLSEDYQMDVLLNSSASCISPLKTITDFIEDNNGSITKTISPIAINGLKKLGLSASQIDDIILYVCGNYTLLDAPHINHESLKKKGFTNIALQKLETALKSVNDINQIFNRWVLGDQFIMDILGLDENELSSGNLDVLQMLGFNKSEIEDANLFCCGSNRINGAPHLKPEAYKIFECINNNAEKDLETTSVSIDARLKMAAYIQPLLSGGIGQVISMPEYTTTDKIRDVYLKSWEYGLKIISVYRENCSILSEYQMELPNNGAISIKTKIGQVI